MGTEFNLEKALAGKAVVHKEGAKVLEFKPIGDYFAILFDGCTKPFIYSKDDCDSLLRMAEEEMYICLTDEEIKNGYVDLTHKINCKPFIESNFRTFKLVEVHGKD